MFTSFRKSKRLRWFKMERARRRSINERETMIVFVYDTECLKDEADDPVKAVLYFHPSWVSDTQKVALCGQLMGTSYFLKDCFFKPKIMALQNGKFVLKEFGRFTLVVGTDRNISDYLLQQRADLLASLVKFFHRDLQSVFDQFPQQAQYKNLSEKLYHIFETYLPILQRNGHIFQNVPKLRMPKTASNIFLDAIQTLQCCQQTKGILGGAVLYHNKVVATQLGDTITKQLVLTDPLHIRTTAEQIHITDFHIPNGVQMLIVYVDVPQYSRLAADAQRAQTLQTTQLSQGLLPFQYAKRKMKRDKSLIFTNIPEEGSTTTAVGMPGEDVEEEEGVVAATAASQTPATVRPKSLLIRPNHLPLRNRNGMGSSKELPESGIASINFDETDSYPEFIGRTSVCSTPMTENKVLQVGNIMSICANTEDESNSNKQSTQKTNRRNSLKFDFEKFFQNFIANPNKQMERRNSFTDLQDSLKKISKKLSLKQFSHSFKTDVNRNGSVSGIEAVESPDFIENDDDIEAEQNSDNSDENNRTSRTITDPTYPVFNENGQPISRSLFQEFIEKYYRLWVENGSGNGSAKKDVEIAQLIEEFKEFDNELKKLDGSLRQDSADNGSGTTALKADRNLNTELPAAVVIKAKTPLDKKSLSLPLKPLADAAVPSNERELPFVMGGRKQSGGVPLTPLMAKLSVLALNEEHNSSSGAWDASTVEIQTPLNTTKVFSRRSSWKCDDAVDALATLSATTHSTSNGLKRLELYMCGQQNMTLLLLMEEGTAHQQPIVQKMFDICVAKFPHMESHLNQTLNVNVEGDKREGGYSFMSIDAKWDTLERNGPWNPMELNTLECMHQDLQPSDTITDLILRSHDAVFYGYKSGRAEFFYKEAAHSTNGIPPPSDPMGNVAIRAKTHLERDNSYILF